MTKEEIISRAFSVIHNDLRHPFYDHTVKVANTAFMYVTGQLDTELRRFVRSETEEEFDQRKTLTNHISKAVLKLAYDPMSKVPRAKYKRIITYPNDATGEKTRKIEGVLAGYWGEFGGLDDYVKTRLLELQKVDPNAWIVQEFESPNAGQLAKPYPFEVMSENAVDYAYERNVLQFLNAMTSKMILNRNGDPEKGADYTVYMADQVFKIEQQNEPKAMPADGREKMVFVPNEGRNDGSGFLYTKGRMFAVIPKLPYNLGAVPAKRVGYIRDIETNGHTFVTPHDCAYSYLRQSLKTNSEFQLTVSLSTFPHRAEYGPSCEAPGCVGGYMHDGQACKACHGTGVTVAKSAQNVAVLPIPQDKTQMLELDRLISFKGPETGLITWMEEHIDRLANKVNNTMYNSDIFSRKEIAETATAKNIQMQNAYDSLFAFAVHYASFWTFSANMCATITDLQGDLQAQLVFPKDFGFKGLTEYLLELESVRRADAGPVVLRDVMNSIILFLHEGDPDALSEYEKLESHNPFSGMSDMEISTAIASPLIPERLKTRYLAMNYIADTLWSKDPEFMKKTFEVRESEIEKLVSELITEAKEQAVPTLNIQ